MPPVVVLIGLPGAGKSAVGARLARRLQAPFADSDHLIVAQSGRSVTDIFAAEGEAFFRELEAQVIATALADFDGVLALGGGAVTTDTVRRDLIDSGVPVVLLAASHEELLRRMSGSSHRPLLADDPAARLAELAEVREPLYREIASITVQTGGHSIAEVADELQAELIGQKS